MNSQKMPLKNSLCLLLAATIWGIAFVAQSVGMEYVGPFTFNGVRSLIGAAVLVPVLFILNRSGNTILCCHRLRNTGILISTFRKSCIPHAI